MEINEIIEKIRNSDEYLDWNTKNPDGYLVHVFKMLDKPNIDEYQIGYYSSENQKITTFTINLKDDSITTNPESEAFREEDTHIEKLEMDKINVTMNQAIRKAQVLLEKEHSQHPADKSFFILQKLKAGLVWNMTFITKTFHVINIKVDATNAEIVENKIESVFEFKNN